MEKRKKIKHKSAILKQILIEAKEWVQSNPLALSGRDQRPFPPARRLKEMWVRGVVSVTKMPTRVGQQKRENYMSCQWVLNMSKINANRDVLEDFKFYSNIIYIQENAHKFIARWICAFEYTCVTSTKPRNSITSTPAPRSCSWAPFNHCLLSH